MQDQPTYSECPVPKGLRPYVRRILHADHSRNMTGSVSPVPTGYSYIGHLYRGEMQAVVDGVAQPKLGQVFHSAGQIMKARIDVGYFGPVGHVLAECTATGFTRLTGEAGMAHVNQVKVLSGFATHLAGIQRGDEVARFCAVLAAYRRDDVVVEDYVTGAVAAFEAADGAVALADVAEAQGVSLRQLSRRFSEVVGVPPKYFCQVLQLNTAFGLLHRDDRPGLAELALAAGYYDQAHFANAMRRFIGTSPARYLDSPHVVLATFLGRSREFASLMKQQEGDGV